MMLRHRFDPLDHRRLVHLCGASDAHLRQVEEAFSVRIQRRENAIRVDGEATTARAAMSALQQLYEQAGQPIDAEQLHLAMIQARAAISASKGVAAGDGESASSDNVVPALHTRRHDLRGRTPNQVRYLKDIQDHDITFGIGPAGTGKTYLAVACAVDALERRLVQRIVLTRPAVEAGERLGFLPGDLAQKVDPYLRPLYDALYDLMGIERVGPAFEKGTLEIAPLAFMRGRTLNHAFVILDEAQNTTPEQMKMFLTRVGLGSRAVVTGDISQVDLPRGHASGLVQAQQVLGGVKGIAFTQFTSVDVVRHPLVARIVDAYDAATARQRTDAMPVASTGGRRARRDAASD
ncbi:MAG: PhoH family protein [Aquabacterium sp.]